MRAVPVQVFAVLHVEQHGGNQFVHVLRLPDDGLKLVVHRLPHHTLKTFDPGDADPDANTQKSSQERRQIAAFNHGTRCFPSLMI